MLHVFVKDKLRGFGGQVGKQLNCHVSCKDLSPLKTKPKYWWRLYNYLQSRYFPYWCNSKKAFEFVEGGIKRVHVLVALTRDDSAAPFRKLERYF